MLDLKIGGVPEHFNYPWYLALKNKEFTKRKINLRWQDFHGGTGEMCEALREGNIDIAIVLTEGIIKDIINGNPSKILQTYVKSPLIWGIHVAKTSNYKTISDLENKTVAISRYGSGSHLMALVNAQNQKWNMENLKFEVVNSLNGGIKALSNEKADYFMWEHFTTKPYVDSGLLNRVGDCPTPWPCFVIAARDEIIHKNPQALNTILEIINNQTSNFKQIKGLDKILAKRYNQKQADILEWLKITEWNSKVGISEDLLSQIQNKMLLFGVINKKAKESQLIKNMYI